MEKKHYINFKFIKITRKCKIKLLNSFNILSNRIIRTKTKGIKDESYALSITGKGNIIKFRENIGFKHPKKIRKLDLIIRSYKANSRNIEVFDNIKRELMIPFSK